jgi:hypothetical protein
MDLIYAALLAGVVALGLRALLPEIGGKDTALWGLAGLAVFAPVLASGSVHLPLDYLAAFQPWQGAPPHNPLLTDLVTQILPFRHLVRETMLAGHLPFWAHGLGTGSPLLENTQASVFSPLHLLTLPLPAARALTVIAAMQIFLCLGFSQALAMSLGCGRAAARFAAVGVAFSSFSVVWLYHPHGLAFCVVPSALLAAVRLAQGHPTTLVAGMLGTTAGQPQILVFGGLGALALFLGQAPWSTRAQLGPRLALAGASAAATLALMAPVWLPVLAYLPESERSHLAAVAPEALNPRVDPRALWTLVADPQRFGNPAHGTWIGPWNFNETASAWAGAIPLVLALALLAAGRWRERALVLGGAIALAAATRTPGLFDLVTSLPLLGESTTGRLRLLWVIAVGLAAARAVDQLPQRRGLRSAIVVLSFASIAGLAASWSSSAPLPELVWRSTALAGLLVLLACLAARPWRHRTAVLTVATAAELLALGWDYHPVVRPEVIATNPAIEALRSTVDDRGGPGRAAALGGRLLPASPVLFGLNDPRGFDPLRPAAPLAILRTRLHRPALHGQMLFKRPLMDPPLLDFLAIEGLLAGIDESPTGWAETWRDPTTGLAVFRNPRALPLFHEASPIAEVAARTEALARAKAGGELAPGFVLDREGCLLDAAAPQSRVTVEDVGTTRDGFVLRTTSPSGGWVGSSVTWLPGWQIVAGEASICRSWGAFVALRVAAGEQRIELRYRPIGWTLSLLLSLAGAGAAGILLWVTMRRSAAGTVRA